MKCDFAGQSVHNALAGVARAGRGGSALAEIVDPRDVLAVSDSAPHSDPIHEIALIPDPQERLVWITERGRRAPPLPHAARVPVHRVPGCTSAVWVLDESDAAICRFHGDAEAPVLKGLTGLICTRASGRSPSEVAHDTIDVIAALGLEKHLTPTRLHGLRQLQLHLRTCAMRHAAPSA